MKRCALFVFAWDLRLHDAPALIQAIGQAEELIFAVEPVHLQRGPQAYETHAGVVSEHRHRFIGECLEALRHTLAMHGQPLVRLSPDSATDISRLIKRYRVGQVFRHTHPGSHEWLHWQKIEALHPEVTFHQAEGRTLFTEDALPFPLDQLPGSFSAFRRKVESLDIPPPLPAPTKLPPPPPTLEPLLEREKTRPDSPIEPAGGWTGGEPAALSHLANYFQSDAPQRYKETRNALDDWTSSTKFSAWLAAGCLSPRQVLTALHQHEERTGANDSTYWIYFELLWREYFQWLAQAWGRRLFRFRGNKQQPPLTSFYPQRFAAWCQGRTPWPIINACMNQLRSTGYMSNRGRQLVASCLVHELQLDWRYGAAYFERQLIDYDMASNWGNWQYLAGVGVDPRGHRKFDLEKQTALYDPDGRFIARWAGPELDHTLDSVDCADWPLA